MQMFVLPVLLQPEVGANLLIPFNDGTATDVVTPSRVISSDANIYLRSANHMGNFKGFTSVVSTNLATSGYAITDMTGISTIGASSVDYTLEFWIANSILNSGALIRMLSGVNSVFSCTMNVSTVSVSGANFTALTLRSANSLRHKWRHIAMVRDAVNATATMYFDGTLIETITATNNNRPITNVDIAYKPSTSGLYNETYINFFALTLGKKYTTNFNPLGATGFDKYYLDNITGYCS